jgi:hypothetical protein
VEGVLCVGASWDVVVDMERTRGLWIGDLVMELKCIDLSSNKNMEKRLKIEEEDKFGNGTRGGGLRSGYVQCQPCGEYMW